MKLTLYSQRGATPQQIATAIDATTKATPQPVTLATVAPPTNPTDVTITNTWAALPSIACKSFEILNERWPTDEIPIRYRRGAAGAARVQPAGKADTIDVAANANEIQVSRADGVAGNIVVQLQVLS